jgi:hypothetical protein
VSRSRKGGKAPGYDVWSRRPPGGACQGYGPIAKRATIRAERAQKRREIAIAVALGSVRAAAGELEASLARYLEIAS